MLLLEDLQTTSKRISYLEIVILFRLVVAAGSGIIDRRFHLPYYRDHLLRFFDHILLLGRDEADLVMQGLGQSRKQLCG